MSTNHSYRSGDRGPVTAEELILAVRRNSTRARRHPVFALFTRALVCLERGAGGRGVRRYVHPDGTVWVHPYTTRDRVPGVEYANLDLIWMTGTELLAQLPAGVGVVLDHDLDSTARLVEAAPVAQPPLPLDLPGTPPPPTPQPPTVDSSTVEPAAESPADPEQDQR